MEEEISLSEIFAILKQQIFLIIFLAILGVSISAVYTFSAVTPTYNATTQMLVNHKADILREIRLEDINTNVQMINTYKDIIKGPVILEQVQERLERSYSVGQLADMISISSNAESQVFSLTVTTANEIASTFQTSIGKIMNVENVTIISVATINAIPVSPNVPMNLVLGLLVGGMVGVGIAFLRAFMDTTLKDSQFIAQEIGWSDLGAISVIKNEEFNAISEFYELENSTDGMRG